MRTYIRSTVPGATYFFTLTLEHRGASTLTDYAPTLREALAYVKRRHPFAIDAMSVLPDHLHALWTLPADDADFATRWMLVKQYFSKRLPVESARRGKKGERTVWQRRYWEHMIRDDADFAAHVDYIHFNPVKHGLVRRASDWPYSSFHRYVRRGILLDDWGLAGTLEGEFGE
jgi:putative transposase